MPKTSTSPNPPPLWRELTNAPSVETCLVQLDYHQNVLLLDSSRATVSAQNQPLGRYSFLATRPIAWIEVPLDSPDPFCKIRKALSEYSAPTVPDLPPFQGGLAGLLSYDLNRSLEDIPAPAHDEFALPAIAMGVYDTVLAWDHLTERTFLFSHGLQDDGTRSDQAAECQMDRIEYLIRRAPHVWPPRDIPRRDVDQLAPSFPADGPEDLLSNFSREEFESTIQRAIDYVHAGDVFQINLAQRLLHPATCFPTDLYLRLRKRNSAPFGGFFDLGKAQIISASPERLISLRDGHVETRPIKGTRRRTRYPEVDHLTGNELEASEKDRAENTMIVDLMRNDLSRVCTDTSVAVTQLCEIEQYESVIHLVSAVEGQLHDPCDIVDLLRAVFPGGSITVAPKVRAMQLISELEPTARGAYCGSLGYIGFDGNADFNILIRTITASDGWWQIPVGGGIVSQSEPVAEFEETRTKAAGMLRALAEK